MIATNDPAAPRLGQDVSAVLGGAAYLTDIERRWATGHGVGAGPAQSGRTQEQLAAGRSERRHHALCLSASAASGAVGPRCRAR